MGPATLLADPARPTAAELAEWAAAVAAPMDEGCPDCGGELELQQPDEGHPERLLGLCLACRSWITFVEGKPVDGEPVRRTA